MFSRLGIDWFVEPMIVNLASKLIFVINVEDGCRTGLDGRQCKALFVKRIGFAEIVMSIELQSRFRHLVLFSSRRSLVPHYCIIRRLLHPVNSPAPAEIREKSTVNI